MQEVRTTDEGDALMQTWFCDECETAFCVVKRPNPGPDVPEGAPVDCPMCEKVPRWRDVGMAVQVLLFTTDPAEMCKTCRHSIFGKHTCKANPNSACDENFSGWEPKEVYEVKP